MLVDRRDTTGNTVLAGTDIGVFSSTDAGGTWAPYNLGVIPKVPIFDLAQNYNGLIFAGTHGRGAYQLLPNAVFPPGTFNITGSMTISHDSAITLSDGRVLVSQGSDPTTGVPYDTTELYDVSTGSFNAGADFVSTSDSPDATRDGATTILLPDGRVLFAGGLTEDPTTFNDTVLKSSELYDPKADDFVATGEMTTPRYTAPGVLLADGRVLIAGGAGEDSPGAPFHSIISAEIYDPKTGTFSPTGNMHAHRYSASLTLLRDGKVLVAGGVDTFVFPTDPTGAEIYDPKTGIFTLLTVTPDANDSETNTLLSNGQVLLAGGRDFGGSYLQTAQLYDPLKQTFTSTGNMTTVRIGHNAVLLINGKVLIVGGEDANSNTLDSAEVYDPVAGIFTAIKNMNQTRTGPLIARLRNELILVAGGATGPDSSMNYPPLTSRSRRWREA